MLSKRVELHAGDQYGPGIAVCGAVGASKNCSVSDRVQQYPRKLGRQGRDPRSHQNKGRRPSDLFEMALRILLLAGRSGSRSRSPRVLRCHQRGGDRDVVHMVAQAAPQIPIVRHNLQMGSFGGWMVPRCRRACELRCSPQEQKR